MKYIDFTFYEETVLNGLIISTHKNFSLKSFRIRANSNPGSPYDLETFPEFFKGHVCIDFMGYIYFDPFFSYFSCLKVMIT